MSIPTTDGRLLSFAQNFHAVASAAPLEYGLVATELTAYQVTMTAYANALSAAQTPETRTRIAVEQKNAAKKALRSSSQSLAAVCNNWPQMTNDKRLMLGLTPRKPRVGRVDPPASAPRLEVLSVSANTVTVIARNPTTGKRAKVANARSVAFYSYVGDTAPTDPNVMRIEATLTDTKTVLVFPTSLAPFTKVWLSACYLNPRGQAGPGCPPVATNLGTWGAQNVPAQQGNSQSVNTQSVKIAA
ncbi:MAG: hypothetical protein QM770_16930 [Tepidisphaeraceae bacterium]